MAKLRIFLDVDGVLNAVCGGFPRGHWDDWQLQECMGFPIRYSPSAGKRLFQMAQHDGVEIYWLTTWEHNANTWIAPLFGWPEFPVVERHDLHIHESSLIVADSGWWKYDEVLSLWEFDRTPFVWIDDDLGGLDEGAMEWVNSLDGQALGINPATFDGLTPEQLDRIEAFITEITGHG